MHAVRGVCRGVIFCAGAHLTPFRGITLHLSVLRTRRHCCTDRTSKAIHKAMFTEEAQRLCGEHSHEESVLVRTYFPTLIAFVTVGNVYLDESHGQLQALIKRRCAPVLDKPEHFLFFYHLLWNDDCLISNHTLCRCREEFPDDKQLIPDLVVCLARMPRARPLPSRWQPDCARRTCHQHVSLAPTASLFVLVVAYGYRSRSQDSRHRISAEELNSIDLPSGCDDRERRTVPAICPP